MQPEVTNELTNLYKVLFETRQKLEFLNQVYKLKGSLIEELLHPQYSVQKCKPINHMNSRSASCLENDTRELPDESNNLKDESNKYLPRVDESEQETTNEAPFDFSQLDSLLQKAKMVRNVEKSDKKKNASMPHTNGNREILTGKSPVEASKSNKVKQTNYKPRTISVKSNATPKSTYQSSYSKKPFLQPRALKRDSHSLPPIRTDGRELKAGSTEELSLRMSSSQSKPNSLITLPSSKARIVPPENARFDSSFTFPPPFQPPTLPPQFIDALTDLKRAQIELARLLKSDHTKIFSPGKEFMLQFEKLYRRDETPRDRQGYATHLYKEIEEGNFSTNMKTFFLDSVRQHLIPEKQPADTKNFHFSYPCPHCLDPKKASVEGIKVPKFYLLKHFNLCSLLSQCYPHSPLSESGLTRGGRLQCEHVDQLVQLHHLIIDVCSLSIKKEVLATCMKVVPQLDLDQRGDRQALRIIVQILDSSKLISFFNFTLTDD